MFNTDAHFMLTLHRSHLADLMADADADRLAHHVVSGGTRRARPRSWLARRHRESGRRHTIDR